MFKVGQKVQMECGGLVGTVTKDYGNGHYRVSFLTNRRNGFSQSFSADELVPAVKEVA